MRLYNNSILFEHQYFQTQDEKTVKKFIEEIKIHKEMETDMLTAAQVLEARGEARGKIYGNLEATKEDVLEVLKIKFKKRSHLLEARVRYCDNLKQLKQMLKKAILAGSLDEIEF